MSHSIPLLLKNMKDKAVTLSPQTLINYLCFISLLHFPPTIEKKYSRIPSPTLVLSNIPISIEIKNKQTNPTQPKPQQTNKKQTPSLERGQNAASQCHSQDLICNGLFCIPAAPQKPDVSLYVIFPMLQYESLLS